MRGCDRVSQVLVAACIGAVLFTATTAAAKKNRLVVTMNTELATMNPFRAKTGWDYPWYDPMHLRMAYQSPDSDEILPGIATSWELIRNEACPSESKDFKVTIRNDLHFHNGDPITAEDVKFSYEQYKAKENAHVGRRIFMFIKDIEIVDPKTLIFHMRRPYWNWKGLIYSEALSIISKKYYEKVGPQGFAKKPLGSGAFKLVKRTVGEGAVYEAVKDHPLFKPQFKRLKIKLVPDATVRTQMLKAGQADLIWGVPPQSYNELKAARGIRVKSIPYPSFFGLNFVTIHESVIRDLNLRLAINHAINRREIAEKLFFGQAIPIYNFWDPTDKTYDPSYEYRYDPELAKKLLAKSAYKAGTELTINFHALLPNSEIVLQAVQNYLRAVGITTKLRQWEGGTLRAKYIKKSPDVLHMGTNYWPGGNRDPSTRLTLGIKKGAIFSLYHSSPKMDHLITEQQSIMDEEIRLAVLEKIYRMLFKDPAVCALVSQKLIYAHTNEISYKWIPYSSYLLRLYDIKIRK